MTAALVSWDDPLVVEADPLFALPWPAFLKAAVFGSHMSAWQPLGWLAYRLLHSVFGAAPWAYHGASLLLHAACAALVFSVLRAWTKDAAAAAAATLLWAWHPIQAESVAWASALSDLLCAALALWAFERREKGETRTALGLFALSALCRWKAVAYPAFALARDRSLGRPKTTTTARFEWTAIGVLTAVCLYGNAKAKGTVGVGAGLRPHECTASLLYQLTKLAWPANLAPGAFFDGNANPWSWPVVPSVTCAVLLLAAVAVGLRAGKKAFYAVCAFILASLPPLLATTGGPVFVYDHHLYLASVAVAAPFAFVSSKRRPFVWAAAGLFAVLSFAQSRYWSGSEALWLRVNAVHPRSQSGHLNYAAWLGSVGRYPEALNMVDEQLALYPGDPLATVLREEVLKTAKTRQERAQLESDAGVFLFEKGDLPGAKRRLESALSFSPKDPQILKNLAILRAAMNF